MKFSPALVFSGLFATALANPVPAPASQLAKRTTNFNSIFAEVEAHTQAALAICADANVDINVDIDIRLEVAAKLKADLDACAELLAKAAAEIKASTEVEIEVENDGCDAGCVEKVVVEKSKKFCEDVDVVVETLGEECVKEYIKPAFVSFGEFTSCVDGIYAGVGASVTAVVEGVIGASLSAERVGKRG
ncbi:uncharacterized protein DNG_09979 [Cephalotrichum gorgonifer]|uniref:Uncharacterized protein n=1 Tax=Cephalotrichum gorgonifer TaxID=2041049 RepID=A0AAE8N948_9PEZI|nr:uncharacterized protein DNG_09979 [Cephalotrichum gorgonifer]